MMEGEYISSDGGGGETVSTQASDEEGESAPVLAIGMKGGLEHRPVMSKRKMIKCRD